MIRSGQSGASFFDATELSSQGWTVRVPRRTFEAEHDAPSSLFREAVRFSLPNRSNRDDKKDDNVVIGAGRFGCKGSKKHPRERRSLNLPFFERQSKSRLN